jgi:hypothetical protein
MPNDMFSDVVTVDEMIAEATRELALRRSVYPRRVEEKKMTQRRADRQIAVQLAIINVLERMK